MKQLFTLTALLLFSTILFAQTENNSEEKSPDPVEMPTDGHAEEVDDEANSSYQTLPDISVKNTEGQEINLQEYANNGKITVISFWATWCKPCIKELKNVNDLLDDWIEDYDMELVAISIDDSRNMAKVRPVVNGLGWDFDVLLDPNGEVQRALNVANPPVTFLIDQKGKIVYTHTGYVEGDEYELEDHIKEIAE